MDKIVKKTKKPKKVKCNKFNGKGKINDVTFTTCNGTGQRDLILDSL